MKLPNWLSNPPVTEVPEPPVLDTAVLGSGTLEVVIMARIKTVFVYGDGSDQLKGLEDHLKAIGYHLVSLLPETSEEPALPIASTRSVSEIGIE